MSLGGESGGVMINGSCKSLLRVVVGEDGGENMMVDAGVGDTEDDDKESLSSSSSSC